MTTDITLKQTVPPEKYELVKEQFAKGCTDNEFQVFLELSNKYGLDPFARQIWAVKGYGSSPAQIIIARDGYLAVAHRSGQFDGMSDPEYETDEKGKVIHVRIRVYRKDMSHPFTGDAWDDEDNLHQSVWNKRQRTMLLKVAESRALRKAFSVSGTYCPEELGYEDSAPYKIEPKPNDIKIKPEPVTVKEEVKQYVPAIDTGMVTSMSAKQEPVKSIAGNIYTVEEIDLRIMPAYQRNNFKLDVFTDANLGNGKYNKDMIDADFRRQAGLSNPAPAPEPEVHGEDGLQKYTAEVIQEAEHKRTIDQPFCVDCGNTRVLPNEEKESRARYGVALCQDCLSKRLAKDLKAKQEAKALEDAGKESVKNLVAAAKKAEESKQKKPSAEPAKKVDDGCCTVCGKKMSKGEISEWTMFNKGQPLKCKECGNKKQTAEN